LESLGSRDTLTCKLLSVACVRPPWVIAPLGDAPISTNEYQTVGTVEKLWLSVDAFPVSVAMCFVGYNSELICTGIWLTLSLGLG